MSDAVNPDDPLQRERALSRWDNEGGEPGSTLPETLPGRADIPMPPNGPAEMAALHVRVIALENLVIALLATASDEQRARAKEMAAYISPRPGFTQHPLTIHAADHMIDLIERASRFDSGNGL